MEIAAILMFTNPLPVVQLLPNVAYAGTVDKVCYFSYDIEDEDDDNKLATRLFLLNLSSRTKLSVYVNSAPEPGPAIESHEFPLGGVSEEVLEAFFAPSLKMQLFEEAIPYFYDQKSDRIAFSTSFDHLD